MDAHPLDFDWRFTDESAALLVNRLGAIAKRCLVVGAPSVWNRLVRGSSNLQVDLVERNPLRSQSSSDRKAGRAITLDICAAPRLRLPAVYDACLFDPPWYFQDTKYWLGWAVRNTAPGASIAFSLWPEDTRPTARHERNEIFRILEQLGHFELRERALRYRIPEFERRALGLDDPWRSGDLVWLETSGDGDQTLDWCPVPVPGDSWLRFGVGSKQVAIRAVSRAAGDEISPLTLNYGWFMRSVSRRDQLRHLVDLWTSDGFVARLGNPMQTIERLGIPNQRTRESSDCVRRTLLEITGVDLYAADSDQWTMKEWHYVN